MRLAHGLYYSHRRFSIRAIWNGIPFATGDVRQYLILRDPQSRGAYRHWLATLLIRKYNVDVESAASFSTRKIKYLSE